MKKMILKTSEIKSSTPPPFSTPKSVKKINTNPTKNFNLSKIKMIFYSTIEPLRPMEFS